jgi:hypothetical protein
MSFDWKEYFTLAQFIVNQKRDDFSQETALRCAVSRSYYAAFCYARNYARDKFGYDPSYDRDDHFLLRDYFKELGEKSNNLNLLEVASCLDKLRQKRNSCDYDDEIYAPTFMWEMAIGETKEVFSVLV